MAKALVSSKVLPALSKFPVVRALTKDRNGTKEERHFKSAVITHYHQNKIALPFYNKVLSYHKPGPIRSIVEAIAEARRAREDIEPYKTLKLDFFMIVEGYHEYLFDKIEGLVYWKYDVEPLTMDHYEPYWYELPGGRVM